MFNFFRYQHYSFSFFVFLYRHELVKSLKRKLDELVSPMIDEELEKYSTAGHIDSGSQETLVTSITRSITQSKGYDLFVIFF
jgi:hypothetical protein